MMAHCIDVKNLFTLIGEHKKVLILASREHSKGDFLNYFFSIDDEDRLMHAAVPAHTKQYMKEADDKYHRMGYVCVYLRRPRLRLGESWAAPRRMSRLHFTGEGLPVREHLDDVVTLNTPMIVIDTTTEGSRDIAFFRENGFHVMDAPLL